MPNPFYINEQYYYKQFGLAWVNRLLKHVYLKVFSLVKQFLFSLV